MTPSDHTQSYYAATARGLVERPALDGDLQADVCVVGGGYSGVSVALNLAERGYSVVLLEAYRIGWGASGRNGGQVCSGFSAGMDSIAGWVGKDDARKLFAMVEEGKDIILDRIQRHAIDCGFVSGFFNAAVKPRHITAMRETMENWSRDFGYDQLTLVSRDEAFGYVNSPAYIGGLYDARGGHLHPLNYCLGLARAAEEAGARLFERSPVVAVEPGAAPWARTEKGRVRAKFLVLCGNAYLGGLVPQIARKLMPMGNYIGATQALGAERARALIPANVAVSDWNFILNYFRLAPDHRLLFGGLASYSNVPPPNLGASLKRVMTKIFPTLGDVGFDYVWGGRVGITMERTPHFGRIGSNVYFAHGYSGTGLVTTGMAGRIIAEALAGQAERLDLFARLPHTTFPGGRLMRMPTLVLAMTWFRMRDWLP